MNRREFVVGASVAALPVGARAQIASPLIGFLNTASPDATATLVEKFRQGLAETGFVEGENVSILYRWAEGRRDRLQEMAKELVGRQVNVIAATGGSPAALVAKSATGTIPVVFQVGVDPVDVGLVASLNKPGGNVTGATMLAVELGSKRLELLKEMVPASTAVGALINPASPGTTIQMRELSAAAQALGLRLHVVKVSSTEEIAPAFAELKASSVQALWIGADPLFNARIEQVAGLSVANNFRAIYQFREFAEAGGLMSYSGSIKEAYQQAGAYCGRILKGEKPADLPVQQSTKVELIVNLKTAKLLGLEVPPALLARADEIIE